MRKIALVGTASSRAHAPVHDEGWEIWGLAARGDQIPRADRWLELHRLDGEPKEWADTWRNTIKEFSGDCEILMLYPEPDLGPKVAAYPVDRITQRFGTYFLSSSFSWAMALAIDEMAPNGTVAEKGCEIGIWGVDMEYGTEYREQRNGFRHFIDLARVLGISIARLASGGLSFEPVPYPFIQDDPLLNKLALRLHQTKAQLDEFNHSLRLTRSMIAQNNALIQEIEGMTEGYDRGKRLKELEKETVALLSTSAKLSKDITSAEGAYGEQQWLKDYLTC